MQHYGIFFQKKIAARFVCSTKAALEGGMASRDHAFCCFLLLLLLLSGHVHLHLAACSIIEKDCEALYADHAGITHFTRRGGQEKKGIGYLSVDLPCLKCGFLSFSREAGHCVTTCEGMEYRKCSRDSWTQVDADSVSS